MSSAIVDFVARELTKLSVQKAIAEALSGLPANSEQSIVGPPDVVDSENPALARPATLAEFIAELKGVVGWMKTMGVKDEFDRGKVFATEQIIQGLIELDQGPIASSWNVRTVTEQDVKDGYRRCWP